MTMNTLRVIYGALALVLGACATVIATVLLGHEHPWLAATVGLAPLALTLTVMEFSSRR